MYGFQMNHSMPVTFIFLLYSMCSYREKISDFQIHHKHMKISLDKCVCTKTCRLFILCTLNERNCKTHRMRQNSHKFFNFKSFNIYLYVCWLPAMICSSKINVCKFLYWLPEKQLVALYIWEWKKKYEEDYAI